MKQILPAILLLMTNFVYSQMDTTYVNLVFVGDIMAHDNQLASALQNDSSWDFSTWFMEIDHILGSADLCAGNLEQPLGIEPYKGYPSFSSPAQYAVDLKQAGFDLLFTSNNHASDRKRKGVIKTVQILDSLEIFQTGTWVSEMQRDTTTPLMINVKGLQLAFLNYTYGTNGDIYHDLISYIDERLIKSDIERAKALNPDKIIVSLHWGKEYQTYPEEGQKALAKKIFSWGADYIIGAHPHVVQPVEWIKTDSSESLIAWSLGNFVSNMSVPNTDGGLVLNLRLRKIGEIVQIEDVNYMLVYVYKYVDENQRIQYRLIPVHEFIDQKQYFVDGKYDKMIRFKELATEILKQNKNVLNWK
jgi:poly-gamma-glutamate capsule biosynthesis protein CapA/YwtB (metallophosphatase superfamily)